MTKPNSGGLTARKPLAIGAIGAAAASIVLLLAGMTAPASAAPPSPADQLCLGCHGMVGLDKKLTNGESLSLHIPGDTFAQSVHSALGCTSCHADVNLASHPPAANPIADKRAFSLAMVQVCRTCHADKFEQWGTSVHAALVHDGNPIAPVCTSCHSPHAVVKGAAEAMNTVPCKACHGAIFTAYSASVHGVLRNGGMTDAPLCFGCHGAHDVRVPSAGTGRRDVCLGCHTEAVTSHAAWLPNVDLHFGVVSCPVCHVPQAQRRVDLILYDSATQKEVPGPVGMPQFESLAGFTTATRPALDPTALLTLLGAANRPGVEGKTGVKGRLEVSTGIENHQLTFAFKAIRDCATCHQEGAAAFQSVVVSVAGPAGIPIRYGVNKDVLSSAFSVNSVGGFYAIGGSRITFLDVLLVLALLGGIGGPLGHLTMRFIFKRFLNRPSHGQRKG